MPERPYFDESGEPSIAPGRVVHVDDLDALTVRQAWSSGP
jgi:hypothetical protein